MIETIRFGNISWSHLVLPGEEDLQALSGQYHFHPLDIEDCRSAINLRPKIDVYADYRFMILHFPVFDPTSVFVDIREIKIFWGRDYLITIGKTHWLFKEMFNREKSRSAEGPLPDVGSSDALLYRILDFVIADSQKVVERIDKDVDECGRALFNKYKDTIIEKMSITRKNVILLNTIFRPQLLLFNKLQSGSVSGFAEKMEDYWGNILDAYQKIWDMVEDEGELIKGYAMTFDSLLVNKTNEVIKILTLISSILLPLTFIASLYGMNIKLPFQEHPYSFILVAGSMTGIAILMVIYFRFKKWM
jgi:magnesium transporter